MKRPCLLILVLLLVFLLGSSICFARVYSTGIIKGSVKDYNGESISDAEITLNKVNSSYHQSIDVDDFGTYRHTDIAPGIYRIKAVHNELKLKPVLDEVKINADDVYVYDIVFEPMDSPLEEEEEE